MLAEGVRIGQETLAQSALSKYVRAPYRPGRILTTKEERIRFVKETVQGALHPSGACRMGVDDMSVGDPIFRVHGIEGLRVADTSIMPKLLSGNTNAPSMMLGKRLAHFIKTNARTATTPSVAVDLAPYRKEEVAS